MALMTGRRQSAVAGIAAIALFGAVACGDDGDSDPGEGGDQDVTLVLQTFGSFGYESAVAQFEADNPNITVDWQQMGELRDFSPQLAQWLAAGEGAGDVVALEEGVLLGYLEDHEGFLDLFEYGGEELSETYLPWKWERGITADGKLLGLGTDVGGLAMCYRADLFEEAGLPSDRDEVSAMWPTWQDYVDAGIEFRDSGAEASWLDEAAGIVQPYVMQNSDVFFYDTNGAFIGDSNPVFREAWDLGLQMADEGLTAGLRTFTEEWTAGFQQSEFATRPCPAWMTGIIRDSAGEEHAGAWDIASIPGGGGNWGGSYLGVPAETEHPQQAYELAKFLTGPEGHLHAYEEVGAMPSSIEALEDPAFIDSTDPYFRDAPVGEIMYGTVAGLEPIHLGALHQTTWETVFQPAMQRAEAGEQSADEAFSAAVEEAQSLE